MRWLGPSLALLGTTVAVATAFVPTAAGTDPGGRFVIGNLSADIGAPVTSWRAQWWKENELLSSVIYRKIIGIAVVDTSGNGYDDNPGHEGVGHVVSVVWGCGDDAGGEGEEL